MGEIAFLVTRNTTRTPHELWEALEGASTSGWPLLRECRHFEVGAALRFQLPTPGGGSVEVSGRITKIRKGVSLTLAQEAPWQGRVRISTTAAPGGSTVKMTVSMEESSVSWLLNMPANASTPPHAAPATRFAPIKIGLLIPLSGTAGVMGRSIANGATLSVEELNSAGAFGRRTAELYIEDDRTSPEQGVIGFDRLVGRGCDVIVMNVSSATVQAVRPRAAASGVLVLNSALAERQSGTSTFLQFGESPVDQLRESIPLMMRNCGTKNWFLLGNDYVWPRTVGMVAQDVIARNNGRVARELYHPLGSDRFDEVLDVIAGSGADAILSSLIGIDAIRFEQQFYDRGYRSEFMTLATNFDHNVAEHVGHREAAGIWSTQDYFTPTLADEMDELAKRYRARFGMLAPALTSMAKAVYDTVQLYAQAAHTARSHDPSEVARVFRSGQVGGQRLRRRMEGEYVPASVARFTPGGFRHVDGR